MAHGGHKFTFDPVHFVKLHIQLSQLIDLGVQIGIDLAEFLLVVIREWSMQLKASARVSNSSPVWISARNWVLPRLMASLTSRRCRRGRMIT